MVLIAVSVIGIVLGAILTQADASMSSTRVVREQQRKVYAADAGVEYAIRALQKDNTICARTGQTSPLPTQTFNGRTVDVQCDTMSGTGVNGSGYAAIVTDRSANALTTQGGGNQVIEGPVYAAQLDPHSNNLSLAMRNGDVYEQQASGGTGRCTSDADQPAGLTFEDPAAYQYHCVSAPPPDPNPSLPTAVPAAAPAPVVTGSCTVFRPGTYSSSIALNTSNYFVSGVYYFLNVPLSLSGSQIVVAGAPTAGDTNLNGNAPCNGTGDPAGTAGTGVKFIFGGSSFIDIQKGQMELFTRDGGPASEGTQGVSIMAVKSTASGWTKSSLDISGSSAPVVNVGNGSQPQLAIHGLIYAPSAKLSFQVTNASYTQLSGGVVVAQLSLQSSASASANGTPSISVNTGTVSRKILITSTAKGVTDGGRDVVASAVVTITSDANRTVSIESWNTQ
jgi:hypothetical protein